MIIVHFGEYVSGGIATYLENLIQAQCRAQDVTHVFLLSSMENSQALNIDSDKFSQIRYSYKRSISGIFKLLGQLNAIKKLNPDVVHLHSTFAGLIRFRFLFKRPNFRVVYCAHGWSFLQPFSRIKIFGIKAVESLLSLVTDQIITISHSEQEAVANLPLIRNKSTWIQTALDFPVGEPSKKLTEIINKINGYKYDLKILYVGRFDKLKGIDVLLDAFDLLHRNAVLILAGRHVIAKELSIPIRENVVVTGWLDSTDVGRLMEVADVVVIPSRSEGFGLVALEASHHSTAIFASNVGALPEIVIDNVTGKLFGSGQVDQLVALIDDANKSELKTFGENAYKHVRAFGSAENMAQQTMQLYTK